MYIFTLLAIFSLNILGVAHILPVFLTDTLPNDQSSIVYMYAPIIFICLTLITASYSIKDFMVDITALSKPIIQVGFLGAFTYGAIAIYIGLLSGVFNYSLILKSMVYGVVLFSVVGVGSVYLRYSFELISPSLLKLGQVRR